MWEQVAQLGYRALVQEMGDVRRRLSQLHSVREDPYDDGLNVDRYRREELLAILRRYPQIEHFLDRGNARARLWILLDDWEYAKAFNRRVIELKRDNYTAIAAWSGVMLRAPDLAADLAALARVSNALSDLGRRLYAHDPLRRERRHWQAPEDWKAYVIDGYRRVRVRAYLVQEEFERKARFAWQRTASGAPSPLRSRVEEDALVDNEDFWDP